MVSWFGGSSPAWGALSTEPAWDSLSLYLCPFPAHAHGHVRCLSLSLSLSNKYFKKKFYFFLFSLSFLFLTLLQLPAICWIGLVRGDNLPLFLRGKAYSLSPLSLRLAVGFYVHALYQVKELPCYPSLLEVFIMNGYWILSSAFSASADTHTWFFFFWSVNTVSTLVFQCWTRHASWNKL